MKHTVIELDSEGHERRHHEEPREGAAHAPPRTGKKASGEARGFFGVDRTKVTLAAAVVVPLVALAVYMTSGTLSGQPTVSAGTGWRDLTPEQRELKFDDEERKRRASGRPAMRRLPEDPPSGPPKSKPTGGRPTGRPVPKKQPAATPSR